MDEPPRNPFSTRFTRPGALPFYFNEGDDAARLLARLRRHNWFGQIVGPHGSGKSTLLAVLRPALADAGRDVTLVELRKNEGGIRHVWRKLFGGQGAAAGQRFSANTQVIIDGYEQLGWWARWLVVRGCRRRGCGLLVTAHDDSGLPTLYTTRPRLGLALALVRRLAPPADVIGEADVEAAWHAHRGDMRETLFSLYDLFERRRPAGD